ncbi:uncharacterized protein BDZ99DRAFT_528464 [Mytilinidion resinicola]|uniref:Uncharacterized protein n=1 Tax=Mytilinidion resinicola TaxID=574789 RepID=A0A6A6Y026_9PEZI|nr:uncharacterized protein BDZ99DRAFT_528464 [Mytilinidion resinicola]KAF2801354.1 hypothetical protein BDZ99DRAFT_528464 [Mytilinidion resinicola]
MAPFSSRRKFVVDLEDEELPDVEWESEFHPADVTRPQAKAVVDSAPFLNSVTAVDLPHSPFAKYLTSYVDFVNAVFSHEISQACSKGMPSTKLGDGYQGDCTTLMTMDTRLLHSIIKGDLARQYRQNATIKLILDNLWTNGQSAIPILHLFYMNTLSSIRLQRYCSQNSYNFHSIAYQIDTAFPSIEWDRSWSNHGRRQYMENFQARRVSIRAKEVKLFCNKLDLHIKNESCEDHPLREIGYPEDADG